MNDIENLPYFKTPESQQEFDDGLKNFGRFGRLWQLALARWLLTGQEKGYMQRGVYDRASEMTGIAKHNLQDYVEVYKSTSGTQVPELSYTHYREVSHLDGEDQEYFLQQASENNWRVSTLKQQIKDYKIKQEQEKRDKQKKPANTKKGSNKDSQKKTSQTNQINFEPNNEPGEHTEEKIKPLIYQEDANRFLNR